MDEFPSRVGYPLSRPNQQPPLYPLQRRFLVLGLWAALIGILLFMDPLAGFSLLVIFGVMGAVWRRGEPPILAFCLGAQWVVVVIGYLYQQVTGYYPGRSIPGNFEGAVFLSLVALLILAAGLRSGLRSLRGPLLSGQRKLQTSTPRYDVRRLFWYVIALYAVNFFIDILPKAIFFGAAEFISNALEFRNVFLCLLFLVILRQRRGYLYGAAAFMYVAIPQLGLMHATFVYPIFLLLVVLLGEWRPWSKSIPDRRRNLRIAWATAGIVVALFVMALFWQERVKGTWRPMLSAGEVGETPMQRIQQFFSTVQEAVSRWERSSSGDLLPGEAFVDSLSSGTFYFSHVLAYVPKLVPHENGRLTLRALEHSVKPRFLFPEKPSLGSNSWLILQYSGMGAAGEEQGTSIGLGYIGEFYIDFGIVGMFIAVFLWGLIVGLIYGRVFLVSPSQAFACAAVTAMLLQPLAAAAEIAYTLGGIINRLIVYGGLLYVLGPWLHRSLLVGAERKRSPRFAPVNSNLRPS